MLMLSRRLKTPLLLSRSLSSHSAAHGLHKEVVKADATYVQATPEELKESLPTKIMFHERLAHWISKFFPAVDIAYFVRNDRESKLSLYYWLGKFKLYFETPIIIAFTRLGSFASALTALAIRCQ